PLAAPGSHGRDPGAGGHATDRPALDREDRPVDLEPRPAPRPALAGGPVRPVDRRADRSPLGPAPAPFGLPPVVDPPRPPDRLRDHPGRRPPAPGLPRPPDAEHSPLVLAADRARLAVLGLAAGPRRVVRA